MVIMKKFYSLKLLIVFNFIIITLSSCFDDKVNVVTTYYGEGEDKILRKHLNLPGFPYNYSFQLPRHTGLFAAPVNPDLATLGRVLFYDKNLSKDKTISCASCHKQELAFSDNVAFSEGVESRATARNSIALGSVLNFSAYYGGFNGIPFFWDNRAQTVQDQSRATLGNPVEMDMKMHEVADVVNDLEYYEPLIQKAYNTKGKITETQILDAIGEFVNSLTNYNTKFDRELDKVGLNKINSDFSGFSASENRGKSIYIKNCASCHGENAARPPVISANNGLMSQYDDMGVGKHTNKSSDESIFKVPTLRNVSRTAPYMHNGMFKTLSDVIDHYSTGIVMHKNLSSQLRSNFQTSKKFNFTQQEKEDLIAFFMTFNDEKITSDDKFSDPFLR